MRTERIRRDVESIARFTDTPGFGASRPTFSASWRMAMDYLHDELDRVSCNVRIDAAGNLHARLSEMPWDEPAWLSGSHLDTVPHGGDYDGVAGVVVPLELLRAAAEVGRDDLPLELVVFAEEEGTTFGRGMLGSHAWAGNVTADHLARLTNAGGQSYLEAGAPHGVRRDRIGVDLLRPDRYLGFIEVHIEQGPGLWKRGEPLAVVEAIAGRRQFLVRLEGSANHAGSTSMGDRRDALAGASEMISALERLALDLDRGTVATVGRLTCLPNAVNVIPAEATFTIDFRSPDNDVLEEGSIRIDELVRSTAERRDLGVTLETTETLCAEQMDQGVCEQIREAALRVGREPLPSTISGALHDAAILAPLLPTAMLFVASRDGISHNPAEFSRIEDLAAAAGIVAELLVSS